jgi:endonuclease/exonuclease/phosphatase (EEP) superfamily protein YafD
MSTQHSQRVISKRPRDFTVLWVNVRRTIEPHNAALSLADQQKIDVVCIQEP